MNCDKINRVMVDLRLLTQLQPNQRIWTQQTEQTFVLSQKFVLWEGLIRRWNGESRQNNLAAIGRLFDGAFEQLSQIIQVLGNTATAATPPQQQQQQQQQVSTSVDAFALTVASAEDDAASNTRAVTSSLSMAATDALSNLFALIRNATKCFDALKITYANDMYTLSSLTQMQQTTAQKLNRFERLANVVTQNQDDQRE
jgi:hypothetical protein